METTRAKTNPGKTTKDKIYDDDIRKKDGLQQLKTERYRKKTE